MLNVSAPYPHAGSTAYIDDKDCLGNDVVRKVRIIAHKPEDLVLIGIRDRLAPREAASGNRTVPLSSLRETEQPETATGGTSSAFRKRWTRVLPDNPPPPEAVSFRSFGILGEQLRGNVLKVVGEGNEGREAEVQFHFRSDPRVRQDDLHEGGTILPKVTGFDPAYGADYNFSHQSFPSVDSVSTKVAEAGEGTSALPSGGEQDNSVKPSGRTKGRRR